MDIDLTQFAFGTTVLIGLVNGVMFALDKNWRAFGLFVFAVAAGSALGFFHWYGIPSLEVGFALGVSSSGVYKVAQKLGGV